MLPIKSLVDREGGRHPWLLAQLVRIVKSDDRFRLDVRALREDIASDGEMVCFPSVS